MSQCDRMDLILLTIVICFVSIVILGCYLRFKLRNKSETSTTTNTSKVEITGIQASTEEEKAFTEVEEMNGQNINDTNTPTSSKSISDHNDVDIPKHIDNCNSKISDLNSRKVNTKQQQVKLPPHISPWSGMPICLPPPQTKGNIQHNYQYNYNYNYNYGQNVHGINQLKNDSDNIDINIINNDEKQNTGIDKIHDGTDADSKLNDYNEKPNDETDKLLNDCAVYIKRPMVIIIGIESYLNKKQWPDLIGVKKDVLNMIDLWHKKYNYTDVSVVYFSDMIDYNKNHIINKLNHVDNNKIVSNVQEFENYLTKIRNYIDNGKSDQYIDSLIFYYTGHGVKNAIKLSNGESYKIDKIISIFSGQSCKHLLDKPIIMIFDCCRGSHVEPGIKYSGNYNVPVDKNENTADSEPILKGIKQYHPTSGFELIFSNWEGQPVVDTVNGGYLTTAIGKVFCDPKKIQNKSFSNLIKNVSAYLDQISIGNKEYNIPKQVLVQQSSTKEHIFLRKNTEC